MFTSLYLQVEPHQQGCSRELHGYGVNENCQARTGVLNTWASQLLDLAFSRTWLTIVSGSLSAQLTVTQTSIQHSNTSTLHCTCSHSTHGSQQVSRRET